MPSSSFRLHDCEHAPSLKDEILRSKRFQNATQHRDRLKIVEDSLVVFEDTGQAIDPTECKVFPAGRQVHIGRLGLFEIWSLETRKRLWVAAPPGGNVFGSSADIDISDDGQTAMIACIYTPRTDPQAQK